MTRKTRVEFDAEVAASLPSNTTGAITPAVMRTVIDDLTDSIGWYDELGSGSGIGDVTGPGSSTTDRVALFADTTGTLLKQSAAAGIYEGDSRLTDNRAPTTHSHVISDVTSLQTALDAKADTSTVTAKQADTNAAWSARATSTAADGTYQTTFGEASAAANVSQTKANLRTQEQANNAKKDWTTFVVDGAATAISTGAVLTIGPEISDNVYALEQAPTTGLDQTANSFMVADSVGLVESISYATGEALETIMSGSLYDPEPLAPVSNVFTFDARSSGLGRNIVTTELAADASFSSACWDYIYENQLPVWVRVKIGTTPYAISITGGIDGVVKNDWPTFEASTYQLFEFSRVNGIPSARWVASMKQSAAAASNPTYVGVSSATSLSSGSSWTLALPTGTAVGDTIVVWTTNPSSSALPTAPTINAGAMTDSGHASDGTAAAMRISWKEYLTAAEVAAGQIACAGGAQQAYIAAFRKAGSYPTVAFHTYAKGASTSTTTISWGAEAYTSNGILAAFCQFLSTDTFTSPATHPLRTECSVVASKGSGTSQSFLGVSNLLIYGSDTIGATTTTKTGVAGRWAIDDVVIQ